MKIILLFCCVATFLLCSSGSQANIPVSILQDDSPTIAKDTVQITLRNHSSYYGAGQRDESTWCWTPRLKYRVNGPLASGSQLSTEFTLPSGKSWVKFDCKTGEAGKGFWWEVDNCGNDLPDEKGSLETGTVSFAIQLRNELAGTKTTLMSGKFKVGRFHYGLDLPKFKNNFVYYVDYDWNLPIAYVFLEGERDAHSSKIDWTFPELKVAMWFKGTSQTTNHVEAYLFYQGKEVGKTSSTEFGTVTDDVTNLAFQESTNEWRRKKFWFNTVRGWDDQPAGHIKAHLLIRNPGEYEIKVLQNGHLARTAKFTVPANPKHNNMMFDNGIGRTNGLGNARIIIPVQVIGDQDGTWDRDAWKTMAFFANPLTGFPQ